MVTPHIISNAPTLVENWKSWVKLGPACTPAYKGKVDMIFYINGKASDYDADSLVETRLREAEGMEDVLQCFGSIQTLYAELTPEQDGYPEGVNHMFFKLFLDERLSPSLRAYSHMFWAEWDVSPLRAHWLDKLREEAMADDFWMKGSPYKGESLDKQALLPDNWNWIGHINGNSLYKLHDADFETLMRITVEREPPSHFWKPFDVSMWRVLHDMPYAWHTFQAYRDKFRFSEFIINLGYMLQNEDIVRAQRNPEAFFMHGDARSAGIVKQNEKFKDGSRAAAVEWSDPVPKSLKLSVLMRVRLRNLDYLYLALKSIEKHLKHVHEVVVVVPAEEHTVFTQMLPASVKLWKEEAIEGLSVDDVLQAEATKLRADSYCTGDYVLHLPFDAVLRKEVRMRDLFLFYKPLATVYPATIPDCKAHREAAAYALGTKPEYCFVSEGGEYVLPLSAHKATREALSKGEHGDLPKLLSGWRESMPATSFDAIDLVKAHTFASQPDSLSWLYMGIDDGPVQIKVPTNFKPVRYPLMCAGNAKLTDGRIPMRNRQLAVLEGAIKGNDCKELKDTLDGIAKQLEGNTKRD